MKQAPKRTMDQIQREVMTRPLPDHCHDMQTVYLNRLDEERETHERVTYQRCGGGRRIIRKTPGLE